MRDVLKSAAVAACLVLVCLWTVGRVTADPVRSLSVPPPHAATKIPAAKTPASDAPACSYDGDFSNDLPGCR